MNFSRMTTNLQTEITPGGLLSPDRILIVNGPVAKKALISRLVQAACRGLAVNTDDVTAQVLKHEETFGFALETGLAIPHARVEELDAFYAALAVLHSPLTDEPNPQAPTRVLFLFLSPGCPAFFKQHLRLLASLAQTFRPELVEEISQLQDSGLIAQKITQQNMVK